MAILRKSRPLHTRILIGLVLGAIAGWICQLVLGPKDPNLLWFGDTIAKPAGSLFLNLIFMVVVPLLFSALVIGIGELGDATKVGKVGLLCLLMTVVLSGTAVLIGLGTVNLIRPGDRIPQTMRTELETKYGSKKQGDAALSAAKKEPDDPPLFGLIPKNPFKEMGRALDGGLLPVMFFAVMFGLALAAIPNEQAAPLRAFFDGVFAVTQKLIEYAMIFAPAGVFFLVFRTTSTIGFELFGAVGLYMAVVIVGLALHQFGTYSLALRFVAKRSPLEFFRQMKTVMVTAFATSSSNATLPVALRSAEEDIGLPKDISSFVLTVGATANQNGTALFEGVTIIFLAQLFGRDLTLAQQFTVMGFSLVAGLGTAGIPGGVWPMIATILVMFKIPAESIGIVYGIDRILDMCRTVLNVTGDMTIAACVTRMSGRERDAMTDALHAVA